MKVKLPGKAKGKLGALKDPKMQLGLAAAVGLGLVVLLKKRQAGGGGVDDGGGSSPQSITPAVMDSSGTDMYNAIASLGQGWENDLRDYSSKLDSLSTQVAANTTSTATLKTQVGGLATAVGKLGTTKPPTSTVKKPTPVKKPSTPAKKPTVQTITVGKYTTKNAPWNSTLSGIANHYHTSVASLKKMNPSIKGTTIKAGQKLRVK